MWFWAGLGIGITYTFVFALMKVASDADDAAERMNQRIHLRLVVDNTRKQTVRP